MLGPWTPGTSCSTSGSRCCSRPAFGWVARKLGLPAVVGYLAAGLAVSPFTPGYVADRHQIELLADVGVVLLLFEVGIEVDLGHMRREHGGLLWASPLQIGITTAVATLVLLAIGLPPYGAALVGLSVAMSSSVVVVNITRSRRRTTDKPTDEGLLGWSVLQDVTGVALGTVIIATSGTDGRPLPVALALLAAFVRPRGRRGPGAADRPRATSGRSTTCS